MKSRLLKLTLLSIFLVLNLVPLHAKAATGDDPVLAQKDCLSQSKVDLKWDLRKLWIDHVRWTREYIVSAIAGLEDQQQVLARLLKNQQDIGNAIKPYYGEAAGDKLAEILREHILLAGKVLDAAKAGNQADLEKYNKEWHRNADDIADFLSKANPNWSKKELQDMLYEHLKLITDDVTARLHKDWNGSINAYDKGLDHMIMFADILADGIIKQFPNKFK